MLQDTPSFLSYWRNARARGAGAGALGPDDLEWAPAQDPITFGDLFRHRLGLERFMWAAPWRPSSASPENSSAPRPSQRNTNSGTLGNGDREARLTNH